MKHLSDRFMPLELASLKCRHGCDAPAVVVHAPEGCICFVDPVQALCMQHAVKAQSEGPIMVLMDLTEEGVFSASSNS